MLGAEQVEEEVQVEEDPLRARKAHFLILHLRFLALHKNDAQHRTAPIAN